jgi:hypothetical protein
VLAPLAALDALLFRSHERPLGSLILAEAEPLHEAPPHLKAIVRKWELISGWGACVSTTGGDVVVVLKTVTVAAFTICPPVLGAVEVGADTVTAVADAVLDAANTVSLDPENDAVIECEPAVE